MDGDEILFGWLATAAIASLSTSMRRCILDRFPFMGVTCLARRPRLLTWESLESHFCSHHGVSQPLLACGRCMLNSLR